ncbi:MAG: hypothetical protein GSR85_06930 [Desulfurococcales archaeon]|nr:hypothetical protein [Desulfurococcales archaeon]
MGLERTVRRILVIVMLLFFYMTYGIKLIMAGVEYAYGYMAESNLTEIDIPYRSYNGTAWEDKAVSVDIGGLLLFAVVILVFFTPMIIVAMLVRRL